MLFNVVLMCLRLNMFACVYLDCKFGIRLVCCVFVVFLCYLVFDCVSCGVVCVACFVICLLIVIR